MTKSGCVANKQKMCMIWGINGYLVLSLVKNYFKKVLSTSKEIYDMGGGTNCLMAGESGGDRLPWGEHGSGGGLPIPPMLGNPAPLSPLKLRDIQHLKGTKVNLLYSKLKLFEMFLEIRGGFEYKIK